MMAAWHLPSAIVEFLADSLDLPHLDVLVLDVSGDFFWLAGIHFYVSANITSKKYF